MKPDLKQQLKQAQQLMKMNQSSSALQIFEKIYASCPDIFDKWDNYYYAKALDKGKQVRQAFNISNGLYKRHPEMYGNSNLYMWLTYKLFIKGNIDKEDIDENLLFRAAQFIVGNTKQEQYSPYEKTIFEITKYLKGKPNTNFNQILEWLDFLNPSDLSNTPYKFTDGEGKNRELASAIENYYAYKIKALFETEQYELCINTATYALQIISVFHYENDIWIKEKVALSKVALGNIDEAHKILSDLIKIKPHYVIHYGLLKIHRLQGNIQEAIAAGASALLDRNGELKHKLSILHDMGELFKETMEINNAYAHYSLINEVRLENGWKAQAKIESEIKYLEMQVNSPVTLNKKEFQKMWKELTFKGQNKGSGVIKSILPHGKAGFIQTNQGQDLYFKISNVLSNRKLIQPQMKVDFYVRTSFDQAKNRESLEAIEITILK